MIFYITLKVFLSTSTWFNRLCTVTQVIEQINNCVALRHLDLSDNGISAIGDLNKLLALKVSVGDSEVKMRVNK